MAPLLAKGGNANGGRIALWLERNTTQLAFYENGTTRRGGEPRRRHCQEQEPTTTTWSAATPRNSRADSVIRLVQKNLRQHQRRRRRPRRSCPTFTDQALASRRSKSILDDDGPPYRHARGAPHRDLRLGNDGLLSAPAAETAGSPLRFAVCAAAVNDSFSADSGDEPFPPLSQLPDVQPSVRRQT